MLIAFITFHHHIGSFVEKGEQDSIELKIGKSKAFPEYTILKLLAILISNGQINGIVLVIIVLVTYHFYYYSDTFLCHAKHLRVVLTIPKLVFINTIKFTSVSWERN